MTEPLSQGAIRGFFAGKEAGGIGIVGPAPSAESLAVALLATFFEIPQLSFGSTAESLSNKKNYPFFGRVIPPDKGQAAALAELVDRYQWGRFLGAISTSDEYGTAGIREFERASKERGTDLIIYEQFLAKDEALTEVKALKESRAKVFLAFVVDADMATVLRNATAIGLVGPSYVWLCPDGCAQPSLFLNAGQTDLAVRSAAKGLLGSSPIGGRGELFKLFLDDWEKRDPTKFFGSGDRTISIFGSYAYDTVYTFARVYDQMLREGQDITNGTAVFAKIRETNFIGQTGTIRFDTNWDRLNDSYNIVNLQNNDSFLTTVGNWTVLEGISFNSVPVQFFDGTTEEPDLEDPFDYWDCRKGEKGRATNRTIKLSQPKGNDPHYIKFGYRCDQFIDCDNMSDEGLSCSPSFVATFISFGIITGMLVLTVPVFLLSVIAFGYIWKKRRIRLLSPLFLIGMCVASLLGYLSTFAWYGQPNEVACNFQPWLLGLSVNLMISFLFAKTFRIWRLFKSPFSRKTIRDPQLLVLVIILMIPSVVLLALWTGISTPTTVFDDRDGRRHLVCDTGGVTGPPGGIVFFFVFVGYTVRLRRTPQSF